MLRMEEIKKWLLNNAVDADGNLNLSGLDLSDFNGDVIINGLKVKKNLHQAYQKVDGYLFQGHQIVKYSLFQSYQTVDGNLLQHNQKVDGNLYQDSQMVKGVLI